jgi:hypothetical protein
MLLTGSRAASLNYSNARKPFTHTDYDLTCSLDEFEYFQERVKGEYKESEKFPGKWRAIVDKNIYEIDVTNSQSNQYISNHSEEFVGGTLELPCGYLVWYANKETCYVHKRSHAGVPIHVGKTLADLIFLTKQFLKPEEENFYQFLNIYHLELLQLLTEEAESRDKDRKSRINFNAPKEKFFGQSASFRKYDHDELHRVCARWPEIGPLYLENLIDPAKALIDNKKFFERDFKYRLTMVQEESIVLSCERLHPETNSSLTEQKLYQWGLTKLISELSKGKFQKFMLDNIHCLTKPKFPFLNNFLMFTS